MATVQPPTFALLLRRHRRSARLTQEELAERAGLSVRAIGDLERGVRSTPRRETLQLLIDALQLGEHDRSALLATFHATPTPVDEDARPTYLLESGSFLGALPSAPMVARRREMQRILEPLRAAVSGHGRLLLLAGEPGVGKTRLAQEAALEATKLGSLVVTGRCYEPQRSVPFYPFLEIMATLDASVQSDIREEIPQRWPILERLLPGGEHAMRRANGLEDQHWLYGTVSSFLRVLAAASPVALLLDDLHWADSSSLQLLLHLARHTRGDRILLLGTYRDEEISRGHPLDRALVDLNRERLLDRVVIHRLPEEGTAALIASIVGEVAVADQLTSLIHHFTDGNPFFVQEVVRALIDRGDLFRANGRWVSRDISEIHVPETVRSAIGERISRLPEPAQTALQEASVLGFSFRFDDLRTLSGRPEEEIETALENAVGAGLVRECDPDTYSFNHALTRQTIYAELSSRRRWRLHLAAGAALERLPPPERQRRAAELAWHFGEGKNPERALAYALLAGDQAQQGFAYGEAERYYRTALDLAGAEGSLVSHSTAEAYAKLGRVLNTTEQYDEALVALERAAMLHHERGDLENEGQAIAEIGWVHRARGTPEDGIARIRPFLASLETGISPPVQSWIVAALYTALARLYFGIGRYHDELAAAERASDIARHAGDGVTRAVAEARRGAVLITLGRRQEARRLVEGAIALADENGLLGTMSVSYGNLAEIYRDAGQFRRSRECLERTLELARRTGVASRIGWTLIGFCRLCFLMGDDGESRAHLEEAMAVFRDAGRLTPVSEALLLCRRLSFDTDRTGEMERRLESLVADAHPVHDIWMIRQVQQQLALHDLQRDSPESVLRRLEPLLDRPDLEEPAVNPILAMLAEAHFALGHEDVVEQMLVDARRRADSADQVVVAMELLRVEGMLRSQQGRLDESRACLDRAVLLARNMPYPAAEALCRQLLESV